MVPVSGYLKTQAIKFRYPHFDYSSLNSKYCYNQSQPGKKEGEQMEMNGKNAGEIAQARGMLEAQQTKLQQIRSAMHETKSEMLELDRRHHDLRATGDINKMMAIKSRSIALNKSVSGLTTSEMECVQRIQSMERYVETLSKKLEGLRHEASRLAEEIAVDGIAPDVKAKLQSLSSRIKMQIEALEGKKRSGPIRLS